MKNSITFVFVFTAFHLLLLLDQPARADISLAREAEDSPLYAASMRNAIADFAARDHAPPVQPPASLDSIIVVEGGKWHALPGSGPWDPRPKPRDVTMDLTCGGGLTCSYGKTCATYPTCQGGTTCNAGPTCYGVPTCYYSVTCAGWYTCDNTCSAYPTCNYNYTCYGTCTAPTCSTTCVPSPTCWDTCVLAYCQPPIIFDVKVPQPGQFQFTFVARGQSVSYNVLYCTNLDVGQWTTIFSMPANSANFTFTHTNNAPKAYYRLSIQNP